MPRPINDDYVPLSQEDEDMISWLILNGNSMRLIIEFYREAKHRAEKRRGQTDA